MIEVVHALFRAKRIQYPKPATIAQLGKLHQQFDPHFKNKDDRVKAVSWLLGRFIRSFGDIHTWRGQYADPCHIVDGLAGTP